MRYSYSKPCWQPETIFLCTSSFAKPHDIQGSIHWLLSVSSTYRSPYFLLRTSFQNQITNRLLQNKNTSRESTSSETSKHIACNIGMVSIPSSSLKPPWELPLPAGGKWLFQICDNIAYTVHEKITLSVNHFRLLCNCF